MTIRRDLSELEGKGLVIRTHGGAIRAPSGASRASSLRCPGASPIKAAIGRAAAMLVESGQTIMVDTGTTALEVARSLPQDPSLTVATTSLWVAQILQASPMQVLVLGGLLGKQSPSLYGPLTERILGDLHVDLLFIGCDGADSLEGFYTADVHLASLERAMIRSAARVVVVTESYKFGQRAFVRYATVDQVDLLVTDASLGREDRARLREVGLSIRLVGEE